MLSHLIVPYLITHLISHFVSSHHVSLCLSSSNINISSSQFSPLHSSPLLPSPLSLPSPPLSPPITSPLPSSPHALPQLVSSTGSLVSSQKHLIVRVVGLVNLFSFECPHRDKIFLICLQHIEKAINVEIPEITIKRFHLIQTNVNINIGHGEGLFIKTDLEAISIDIPIKFEKSLWIAIKLSKTDQLLVGCIYWSPNSSK